MEVDDAAEIYALDVTRVPPPGCYAQCGITRSMAAIVDVFIDGTLDASPATLRKAASSVARCLAVSEPRALTLLGAGRVRVRANLAPDLADELVRLLEKAGVRTAIAPAIPVGVGRPPPSASSGTPKRVVTGEMAGYRAPLGDDDQAITGVFDAVPSDPVPTPIPDETTSRLAIRNDRTRTPTPTEATDPRARRPLR
jgi:hypothetical protein